MEVFEYMFQLNFRITSHKLKYKVVQNSDVVDKKQECKTSSLPKNPFSSDLDVVSKNWFAEYNIYLKN